MSILDTDLLTELQALLIDTASWGTGQWTEQEALDALNQAQDRFLRETGMLVTVGSLSTTLGSVTQSLPTGWQQTQRVAWKDTASGTITALGQSDPWEADQMLPTWDSATATRPQLYSDINVAPAEYQLMPASSRAGTVSMHYLKQGTTFDGSGVAITVPQDAVDAIKWLALATLLRKLNRSIDADRAGYAEQRYRDIVEAVNFGLLGF